MVRKAKKASLKAVKICKTIKVGVVDKAISSHKNLKITVKVIKMVKCCKTLLNASFMAFLTTFNQFLQFYDFVQPQSCKLVR